MNPSHYIRILLLFMGLGSIFTASAQSYLKSLNHPEQSLKQKITRFKNGDLLIGDSSFEGSSQDGTAAIYLTRMDQCGLVLWSKAFEKQNIQLVFKDFAINDQDEVFVFGSAIDGLNSVIFLLQVNGRGEKKRFRTYDSNAPSNAAFSIALQNDKILTFGRILEIGSTTTGFMALFDTKLSLQWAKKITPFTFEGAAIIDTNGELVARTKAFHFKFDNNGALLWAREFERALAPEPIAGPIEISGGYLFEAFFQNEAFFYKLDPAGQLVWTSALFPSTQFPAAVQEITGGELIIHYSVAVAKGNSLHQLILSPAGKIIQQRQLDSEFSFNIGSVSHSFGNNEMVNIIGNKDALTSESVDISDYLIQFSLDSGPPSCIEWSEVNTTNPNGYALTFPHLDANVSPLELAESAPGGLETYLREAPFFELCGATRKPILTTIDTLVPCDETWLVSLPSEAFIWEDDYPNPQRLLEANGTYRAKNSDCEDPMVYEFQLEQAVCDCQVYLPNAFSPNGDGQNDVIQLFTACEVTEIKTSVFDRWGNLIFQGQNAEQLWNGTHHQKEAPAGVYILMVSYQLLSESGGEQQETLTREVLLVR